MNPVLSLPSGVLSYVKSLMCVFENANCVSLSMIAECSHDRLSRVLNNEKLSWQTLLESFISRTFGRLREGWLIIDDTIISKQFAKQIENVAWVFDSKIKKSILGLNLVLIAWSNGRITIPLAVKIYRKDNGKTRIDLAIELINITVKTFKIRPKFITFDSWYAATRLLKKIDQMNWIFVTQLKRNRKFNGVQLKLFRNNPYWIEAGKLTNGLNVSIVRHGKKYFATNALSLDKKTILKMYRGRWTIETVFKMLHSKLGMDECQARSIGSQKAHFHLTLLAFTALEKERYISGKTIYEVKRECSFDFNQADIILDKLIFQGA
jgi:putative transposase